jgi:[CysO sulfur-carrier protein]-S-L-cysteine hydrolase
MKIARDLLDQIVDHARRDAPNECCGLVGAHDGRATSVHPTENVRASPLAFEVHGPEAFRIMEGIESSGGELAAIYHSHTRTDPYPSQTDVNFAANWPGIEWLIVGLTRDGEASVRSYRIDDGRIEEVPVEVE